MDIKTYFQSLSPEEKVDFAAKAETSVAYLSQIANGHRKAGVKLLDVLVKASGNQLTKAGIRPDIFGDSEQAA